MFSVLTESDEIKDYAPVEVAETKTFTNFNEYARGRKNSKYLSFKTCFILIGAGPVRELTPGPVAP